MFEQKRGGWVGRENAFFEFFLREVLTTPPPARPIYPRGGDPSPQRARNNNTQQAARQTTQGTIHTSGRWARCTGLHSIQDRPCRVDRNGGGVLGVSETVQIWTQRSGSKIYLIYEYICCVCNANPLYSVSKV